MIKKNLVKLIIGSALILLPMLVGLLLWNQLPEEMVTHWGINSVPDGWSGKGMVVFGIPAFMLALHWVGMLVSSADPKSKDQSKKPLDMIFWIVPVIAAAVCGVIYAQAMGMTLNVDTIALVLMGVGFLVIGNYLPKCKQNRTLGIKLPWTLKSEANWNATHRLAGKLWMAGGVLFLLCVFLPKSALYIALLILLPVMVLVPLVYSYLYYKKHDN